MAITPDAGDSQRPLASTPTSATDWDAPPPAGAVWVCIACGRIGRGARSAMGDTSCVTWARLCHDDDTLKLGANGLATAAKVIA